MHLAWLSQGRLELWDGDTVRSPPSAWVSQLEARHASIQRRNAWKHQGRGARFAAWGPPSSEDLPAVRDVARFVAVSRGRVEGELLTVLSAAGTSALLARPDLGRDDELRLYHASDVGLVGLAATPSVARIAVALADPSGATHLGLLSREGSELVVATEGDVIDAAPRWDADGRLLYQSAGIGRDARGVFAGRAAFGIARLDPTAGTVSEVAADPAFDLLSPASASDGALLYLRRPFAGPTRVRFVDVLKDVLLFPWRVARAAFAWLELFVVRYSGKPLVTGGGPRREGPDEKQLWLLGNEIDVEKARRASLKAGDEVPALVPQSWELVRDHAGRTDVLARGVLAYDVTSDGTIVFTNGRGVFVLGADGRRTLIATREQVEAVVAYADTHASVDER